MKYVYLVVGVVSMILGAIGVVLPVLPTVPFLLLASFCFAKGSDRFNMWFKSTKLYKNNLESFEKNKAMTRKTKWKILIFATIMLLFVFFRYDVLPMRIFILLLIGFKYYYFLKVIKTVDGGDYH
nr:YbaN family protein [uncultured Peptostreptococcus sp.]